MPRPRASAPRLALPWHGTPAGRAGDPAAPGPSTQTSSFQGKAGKGIPRDWGAPRPPLPVAPILPPAGPELRCPGMERNLCRERSPESLLRVPRPGDPAWEPRRAAAAGGSLVGWGQTDRGRMTHSVLSRFHTPIVPTRAALPRPATPGVKRERDPVGRDPRSPPALGSVGTAAPGSGSGGHGTAEPGIPGFGAGAGQERGSGCALPGDHSPLEHAGSGTGRPLRCWPGCPRSGRFSLHSSSSSSSSFFFFFFFPTFSLFPPLFLRGGA